MSVEQAYWRDIELLTADLRSEWDERMAELIRGGKPLAMRHTGTPLLHRGMWPGHGSFPPNSDVQIFTPVVLAQARPQGTPGRDFVGTWTKPPGITNVDVFLCAPGAGGGSGRMGSTTTISGGGGSGSSGNVTMLDILASDLNEEVPLIAGCGGTGGPAISANSTNGTTGGSPSDTTFGTFTGTYSAATYFPLCIASAGTGGGGGTPTGGSAGGSASNGFTFKGSNGVTASSTGAAGSAGITGLYTAGSGGSGGGLTSANATGNGGSAGASTIYNGTGIATASNGTSQSFPNSWGQTLVNGMLALYLGLSASLALPHGQLPPDGAWFLAPGGGGGGGHSSNSVGNPGGNGANGYWGGGGGGGGAGTDSVAGSSGAGGNGGDGFLIVVSF